MTKKRFFPALLLTLVLALSPLSAFAESGAYAVKFYPGDYGTMTKNDQIPFVYYGIDDDVNNPYYYKLNVSETETLRLCRQYHRYFTSKFGIQVCLLDSRCYRLPGRQWYCHSCRHRSFF